MPSSPSRTDLRRLDGATTSTVPARGPTTTVATLLAILSASACATTGATWKSGVGDAYLEHAPYYAGKGIDDPTALRVGHLPVTYQRGASQPGVFDPALDGSLQTLLDAMTDRLEARGVSVRLVAGGQVSAVAHADTERGPDVRFGCVTETGLPDDDCAERDGEEALGRGHQAMRLSVGRPSPEWTRWIDAVMTDTRVDLALVVTLEVGQYLTRQRGWRGSKEVELGTGRVERLPWLTSLETPVSVLQLTGALMGRDGKAVRIGAEGLVARRTRITIGALGAQEVMTAEDVERLCTERRDDLPGAPLLWEAALDRLVEGLLGRG